MADAAVTSGLPAANSVNPNKDVGGEGKYESRANSTPTFGDLDDAEVEQKPQRRRVEPEKKGQVKEDHHEPKPKDEREKPAKAEKPKAEAKDKADGEQKELTDAPADPEQKPKPKNHKFKNGEQAGELSGEVVFAVPVDGKKEEVPLQELINNYNGKKKWDVELGKVATERTKFTKERQDFDKERDEMNSFATELVQKSTENPESAIDYLAELTQQDPVDLKEKMLRQHIAEILPLANMNREQLEQYIREKKLDWRDASHKRRDDRDKQARTTTEISQQRQKIADAFGLDEERYDHVAKHVKHFLKGKEPTPAQVAEASRRIMAAESVEKAVPHLAKRADFGRIMDSVLEHLMKNPHVTQDQVESLLKEVWGDEEDDTQRPLRGVANRAAKNARIDDSETPSPERGRANARRKAETFDDL